MELSSPSELTAVTDAKKRKETREIVTPYAFQVSDDLFGTPLASPTRRGLALLVDMTLIGLLTQVSSALLAGIAAWTFFKAGNRLQQKKRFNRGRIFLRFLTALLLFVFAFGLFDEINQEFGQTKNNDNIIVGGEDLSTAQGINMIAITAKYLLRTREVHQGIENGKCPEAQVCWQAVGEKMAADVAKTPIGEAEVGKIFEGFVEQTADSLTKSQQQQVLAAMHSRYKLSLPVVDEKPDVIEDKQSELSNINTDLQESVKDMGTAATKLHEENKKQQESFSPIAWAKGIAADLGLGFGWAAFYFSIFTAWWHGQTPGKRLFKIKVLKLDGSGLNIWESFGRYGGYGAGLATGLLGFLQIYWDPNRQAIQDKISETLVINLAKPKIAFEQTQLQE